MIATQNQRPPAFCGGSGRRSAPWVVVLVAMLLGCASDRQTTLLRSSRARAIGELRAERERQERELQLWEATREEAIAATDRAHFESVKVGAALRAVRAALNLQLEDLADAEKELEAARVRAAEIEEELRPLRALEKQRAEQERLLAEAESRVKQLAGEVAKATEEAAAREAQLKPKLAQLQARLAELKAAGVAIEAAEKSIATAAKILAPPQEAKEAPKKKKD